MALHLIYQPENTNSIFLSFAPGIDPYEHGPRIVPPGIPYWFVESEFIMAKEEIYGSDRIGWVLVDDPDLGEPDGYGA
jgi:hypothetical protein